MKLYKNLKELKSAYDSGKLSRKLNPVLIDNDCADVDDDQNGIMFHMLPDLLLEEALDILGIPHKRS